MNIDAQNEWATAGRKPARFSSAAHFARQTAQLLAGSSDETEMALAHYSQVARDAAELSRAEDQATAKPAVFVMDVSTEDKPGVKLAWQTCECGERLSAFGTTEASAVRNVAGEVFEHMHGSVIH
jgi:hypothetical protein